MKQLVAFVGDPILVCFKMSVAVFKDQKDKLTTHWFAIAMLVPTFPLGYILFNRRKWCY